MRNIDFFCRGKYIYSNNKYTYHIKYWRVKFLPALARVCNCTSSSKKYLAQTETPLLPSRAAKFRPLLGTICLSADKGSLSCPIRCDKSPRFLTSHLRNGPTLVALYNNQGVLRILTNPCACCASLKRTKWWRSY